MKVYIVMTGFWGELSVDKVFFTKEGAEKYVKTLSKKDNCEYDTIENNCEYDIEYDIVEREVEQFFLQINPPDKIHKSGGFILLILMVDK